MRAFLFVGSSGSSASTETLRKRVSYGGRKSRRAKQRLEERLTWGEVGALIAHAHGASTVYVDDRRRITVLPNAVSVPADGSLELVVPEETEMILSHLPAGANES